MYTRDIIILPSSPDGTKRKPHQVRTYMYFIFTVEDWVFRATGFRIKKKKKNLKLSGSSSLSISAFRRDRQIHIFAFGDEKYPNPCNNQLSRRCVIKTCGYHNTLVHVYVRSTYIHNVYQNCNFSLFYFFRLVSRPEINSITKK